MTPAFYALARLQARRELRKQGYGFFEIRNLIDDATDEVIDAAAVESPVPHGAIGDGTILRAIVDFFRSEAGQALIAALLRLLLVV